MKEIRKLELLFRTHNFYFIIIRSVRSKRLLAATYTNNKTNTDKQTIKPSQYNKKKQ